MATRFDSWESYFYPETYDPLTGQGVLRNLREWRSADALASYEYRMTAARRSLLGGSAIRDHHGSPHPDRRGRAERAVVRAAARGR